ncbi:phosphate starvation-inducible protein PhoH [Paenibacillus sp. CGMCC 1.16610]|uniref:Phosphate starvation-inducible protein PhoH n=1 Tax=Paenibacillus anseongense TaxID=2682845 RepID=A0ABW9U3S0_9BACL|nr:MULTISPECIES: phosphate starvation-inducible protein PhoH [Paenibacillus]MBA2938705.1 phosphate starvation-inducible protein PhoH [Paenibacillus sp. CGMCC 1.16610]MVQ34668.1 phosphate starvation-inducible protein PhoH [Paenibacillus anseongense]
MTNPAAMPLDFLMLDSGAIFSEQTVRGGESNPRAKVLDQYDLPSYDLLGAGHKFLIIDEFIDQELMAQQRARIRAFLDQGNILSFGGHLFRSWIPGASAFIPKTIHSHHDYLVTVGDHPIFEGVRSEDITYNKGVAGFFSRGHHPVPEGAEILLRLAGAEPITYIDRQSSEGTIVVHAGRNLLNYRQSDTSTGRIGEQFHRFLYEEHERLQQRQRRAYV